MTIEGKWIDMVVHTFSRCGVQPGKLPAAPAAPLSFLHRHFVTD